MACSDNVSSSSRMASAPRRPSINSSVMVFVLAEDALFAANCLVASGAFDEYVLTGADFASLGPALQDLVIHAEGVNFGANFSYRVALQYRYRLGGWQDAGTVLPLQTSGNYVIGAPFVDRTKFGRELRLVLQTQVTAGSSVQQRGTLSVSVAARVFCA
jgi:hypothetical protein